jgi:hypothetical protein
LNFFELFFYYRQCFSNFFFLNHHFVFFFSSLLLRFVPVCPSFLIARLLGKVLFLKMSVIVHPLSIEKQKFSIWVRSESGNVTDMFFLLQVFLIAH